LLVGPYSRFQWHHPGPFLFYAVAPFYGLSGFKTAGLSAGAVAINLTAVALLLWTMLRHGPPRLAIAVAVVSAFYLIRVPELLVSPWNPHTLVVPMMALLVVTAAVANGRVWLLPLAAVLASFVVQCHVAVGPAALALLVVAVALMTRSIPRSRRVATLSRPLAVTCVAALLAWCLPIVEQLKGQPGNLTELWKFFFGMHHAGQPVRIAAVAWGYMLSGVLRSDFSLASGNVLTRLRSGWPLVVAVVELLIVALSVRGTADDRGFVRMLATMLILTAAVSFWSITRIDGPVSDHEVFWLSGVGALNLAVAVEFLVGTVRRRSDGPTRLRPVVAAACIASYVACACVALVELATFTARSNVAPSDELAMTQAADAIHKYTIDRRVERPLFLIDQETWSFAAGVLLQLQKRGDRFAVERDWLPMFIGDVVPDGHEPVAITIGGRERHFRLSSRPGNIVVGEYPPVYLDAVRSSLGAPDPLTR
jgi:hypothetical protein